MIGVKRKEFRSVKYGIKRLAKIPIASNTQKVKKLQTAQSVENYGAYNGLQVYFSTLWE